MTTTTTDLLATALEYARLGWPVLPLHTPNEWGACDCYKHANCDSPGKHPRTMHGLDDATLDEETIQRWWGAQWPNANIGVDLKRARLLDIAPDSIEWHAEFVARGLPPTSRFRSGGGDGHEHHLYALPEGSPTHRLCKEGAYDILSNGYAVMPPSLHASGRHYEWLEQPGTLAPAPAWVLDQLTHTAQRADNQITVTDDEPPVRLHPEAMERWYGRQVSRKPDSTLDRSQSLWWIACDLASAGATHNTICRAVQDRDEALGWSKYTGRSDVQVRYSILAKRALESPDPTRRLDPQVLDEPLQDDIISASALLSMDLPEPRWAVPGVLPEGVALLVGKSKLGKSWLALDIALAVATGKPCWGKIAVVKGDVLYLALEDSRRRLQDRLGQLVNGVQPDRLALTVRSPRANEGGLERIFKWVDRSPEPRLVIIDVLAKFRPREINNKRLYDLDYDAISPLADIARQRGICVLVLHHANKLQADDPIDSISGTTGLAGAADALGIFRRERGKADASLLVTGRDVEEREIAFRRTLHEDKGYAWEAMGDAVELRLSDERQQIIDVIGTQPGMTPAEIAGALRKSPGAVRYLLFKLVQDGRVRIQGTHYFPGLSHYPANTANTSYIRSNPEIENAPKNVSGLPLTRTNAPAIVSPRSTYSAVSSVSAVSENGENTAHCCRVCGGELQAGLERIGLHHDCVEEVNKG